MLILLLDLIDDEEEKVKFEIVFKKYENLVRYIALKKLDNQELADESAQEAWIDIARNFKKVGEPDDLKTKNYISTIANSWANKMYRREKKNNTNIEYNEAILTQDESTDYFEDINKADIAALIDRLPEQQKMYLYLSYSFGYTSKEIGKLYGVTDASVRKSIQFAKARIRQEFEK